MLTVPHVHCHGLQMNLEVVKAMQAEPRAKMSLHSFTTMCQGIMMLLVSKDYLKFEPLTILSETSEDADSTVQMNFEVCRFLVTVTGVLKSAHTI